MADTNLSKACDVTCGQKLQSGEMKDFFLLNSFVTNTIQNR